ncbi:type I polyketide synthase [Mycobacterium sp. E2479]|uniref:sulfolipid-1 biosynthesis phthioceranic/hydroxyphthioceranic acid synthase n=1 Tax=Mycobacterium sp. E2479 TaxID=1834134 RepID=UPI0007FC476C|nr:type I polyketide synthase [Mycobacterium sp. E2479]OBH58725.1 polyketide synthase [Mycobacterium sp. E2479]
MVAFRAINEDDARRSDSLNCSPGATARPATPVAIIGVACRLPGGIDSPDRLWDALLRGDDLITEIPADRWNAEEYYDPEVGVPGRSVSKWGSFLDDVAGFDYEFFGIEEREATAIDPQHRLLLETSWEAVEHAGLNPANLAGSRTAVYVGLSHDDYLSMAADTDLQEGAYAFLSNSRSMASGRIAYAMDLRGQAITVDTACSSGLVTVHLACRSLHDSECDLTLAGGVSLTLDPRRYAAASASGVLSATGRCHAFDVAADGFAIGEGSAMMLLKRLPDALRDGDRILAVIRGTSVNNGGRSAAVTTPSRPAQVAAYRTALAAAGVDAGSVGMVEAHGSGDPAGDRTEFASLAEVYGTAGPCALGSLKTNFGHSQSISGTLGLIKAALALRHGVIPGNLRFTRLPDELAQAETNIFVPQSNTPWPSDGLQPRRAAVSAYGFSGTNAHAILEQAPATSESVAAAHAATSPLQPPLLLPLSSTSADELRRTAGRLADWVRSEDEVALPDLAYTLSRRRGHRPVRTTIVTDSLDDAGAKLREVADGGTTYLAAVGRDDRGPVWVFSGNGSLWPAMGAELMANEPVFAATIAAAEPLIAQESGFSVTDAMTAPEVISGVDRLHPTLFAMQVALAATMKSYGAPPGAVIGHSLGETAAAVAAGALSLADGVRVVCRSSRLMARLADSGAMALVEMPAQQVLSELMAGGIRDVVISVVASPQSTIIGGTAETVRELVGTWQARAVMARELATDLAWHTPLVQPILDELSEALAELAPTTPEVPFYSTSQFDPRELPAFDARYWVDNFRRTVRFAAAVQAAMQDGYRVFAELTADSLLDAPLEQNARSLDVSIAAVAGVRRDRALPHGLRSLLADLHSAGAAVDFSALYPSGRLVDAPLPTWTHRRLLLDRDDPHSAAPSAGCTVSVHPLLGAHVRLQEEPERHVWQGEVGTAAQPWLKDHHIQSVAALPAAAHCEMALAAARTVLGETSEVRDIRFEQALPLDEQTTIGASASLSFSGAVEFRVEASRRGEKSRLSKAVLHAADDGPSAAHDIAALLAAHPHSEDGAEVRKRLEEQGVQYGPAFTGLGVVHTGEGSDSVLGEVALPRQIRSHQHGYTAHPALLDACFQSVAAHPAMRAIAGNVLALPQSIRRLRAYGAARNPRYCYTRVSNADSSGIEADLEVLDEHGGILLAAQGLRLDTGLSEKDKKDRVLAERLLTIKWRQRELPGVEYVHPGSWLLISTTAVADVLATDLPDALKSHGAQCTTMSWTPHADHAVNSRQLRQHLHRTGFTGVVVLMGPRSGDDADPSMGRQCVQHLVRIIRELPDIPGESSRLYVVTRTAQTVLAGDEPNLEQAGLRGLIRVVGAEHPHLRVTHVDLDADTEAEHLARQLEGGSEEDETAWRNGEWYTARLSPSPLLPEERRTTVADHERDGMRLQIRTPGALESMELVACERVAPGPKQIEVAVSSSGVNYTDVLLASGRLTSPEFDGRSTQLGTDFAGVVTAVGSGVADHKVGDHVGGLCHTGSWGTFLTCDARSAVTLPAGLSDEQAAAVTTPTATAWYGLHELAHIDSNDKVLIHSGTGGVGQAAIAIARAAGAEIFVTAGNEQRRNMLHDMGIEYVYDSRSVEFADLIRRDTDGYGVDIVLNSLTGAGQRAGIELLAHGGRFIDIGKHGSYGEIPMGFGSSRRNLAFYAVDLASMAETHPHRLRTLLSEVYQLTADGVLPTPQNTRYPLEDAANAIRAMRDARHAGKLLLDIPRTGRTPVIVPPPAARVFRDDGAYIITGGLGSLGLFLAERMASPDSGEGCGRIVLCSLSQPAPEALDRIERIRAMGADLVVECGDIAEPATARRLVMAATATGLALRGVVHAAAVTEDAALTDTTDELIERSWAPKVYGAWHLHHATAGQPLDWFCSFSSAAALVGSPGQGAYAAANSWLDAFSLWRRAKGLPANAIAWGQWGPLDPATTPGDVDIVIAADEGAYAFETLLRHERTYTGYAVMGTSVTAFAQHSPFAEAFRSTGQTTTGSRLRAELEGLPFDERPTRLLSLISDQVRLILRRNVDVDRPLSEYGMDSLGALELRTRIETETGIRINSTELVDVGTVRGLAGMLCERLAESR